MRSRHRERIKFVQVRLMLAALRVQSWLLVSTPGPLSSFASPPLHLHWPRVLLDGQGSLPANLEWCTSTLSAASFHTENNYRVSICCPWETDDRVWHEQDGEIPHSVSLFPPLNGGAGPEEAIEREKHLVKFSLSDLCICLITLLCS